MYKITRDIVLDVNNNSIQGTLSIPRGTADAYQIAMHINYHGKPLELTDCIVQIKASKPDGTEIYDSCRADGDIALYNVSMQFAAVVGYVDCQVEITGTDSILYTPKFQCVITEGVGLRNITSSDEYSAFQTYMTNADTLIQTAKSYANKAEGMADYAELYANDAQSSANAALSSKTDAANSASAASASAENAANSASEANNSAAAAATSENNAKISEDTAKGHAEDSELYARRSKTQADNAGKSAKASLDCAADSKNSATAAATSESNAKTSEDAAKASENAAYIYATECSEKADICSQKAEELTNRIIAQSVYDTSSDLAEGVYFVKMGV